MNFHLAFFNLIIDKNMIPFITPKVDDTTSDYLLPTGVILTAQEREEVQERWNEYNTAINQ